MKIYLVILSILSLLFESRAFGVAVLSSRSRFSADTRVGGSSHQQRPLHLSSDTQQGEDGSSPKEDEPPQLDSMTREEKEEIVGNLVADDEWNGLTLELAELVRLSIVEDLKKNTREFIGKDEYKIGDLSKEVDARVKNEVANLRGKDEYELGDLSIALDDLSKELVCEMTGDDEYKFGDLSIELDKRVKNSVADFCGKDTYEFGDLSKEISKRVSTRVEEFTGKDYEFGDISREIDERRKKWINDLLGEEAAANYQFGDVTKKFLSNYAGKDAEDYQFGDATKKLVGNLFGGKKKRGGDK